MPNKAKKTKNSFSDEELAVGSLENQAYFALLVERYQDKLFRYILRITNVRHEEAEDILQEVFLKTYKNLNNFDPSMKFSSWIYRITHNQTISAFRKKKVRPQGVNWEGAEMLLERLGEDSGIEKKVDLSIIKDQMSKMLEDMDVKYRDVLVLKYLEQKSYQEISDIIKKPVGTVGTLINRAKKQFKKIAQKNNFDVSFL